MQRSMLVILTAFTLTASGCATQQARSSSYVRGSVAPASTVSLVSLPGRSGRASADVARFVRSHYGQLQFCHDVALARGVAPSGTATVEVTLAEDGYVLRARVTDRQWSGDGAEVEECMLTTVRRWVFPKSGTMDQYVHSFGVNFGARPQALAAARTR